MDPSDKNIKLYDRVKKKSQNINELKADKYISKLLIDIECAAENGETSIVFHKIQWSKGWLCCCYKVVPFEVLNIIRNRMKKEGFNVMMRLIDGDILICW
jgi:hypothetical protein